MEVSLRIEKLRENMKEVGIDYCLIPTSDCHDSEYVSDYFKVREYYSGFTGSAGNLLIGLDDAYLFTDGRYFLQAEQELKGSSVKLMRMGEKGVPGLSELIVNKVDQGMTFGFDGRLIAYNGISKTIDKLIAQGAKVRSDFDPATLMDERAPLCFNDVYILKEQFAGESCRSKLDRICDRMKQCGADTHIVTTLDDIAWTLNLRGSDIEYNPVFFAYLLINSEGVYLYADCDSFSKEVKEYLDKNRITLLNYFDFYEDIEQRVKKCTLDGVLLDLDRVGYLLYDCLKGSCLVKDETNPATRMKCIKNQTEIENIKKANIIDAIAMLRFNKWLDEVVACNDTYPDELLAQDKLYEFRALGEEFMGGSFATICAYGDNGAIVHYESSPKSNKRIVPGSFLLIDSGGQYKLGTTDITRTYAIGEVPQKLKEDYTLVLRAMLRLGKCVFKEGTTGSVIDMIARAIIWKRGRDFKHGTGHGIGYFLNVHEGPVRISINAKGKSSDCVFEPGMLSSDEPGLYVAGEYGIRIENDILCKIVAENDEGTYLGFEYVTYVPIDTSCIAIESMSSEDIEAINEYHELVYRTLSPYLKDDELEYLKDKCKRV